MYLLLPSLSGEEKGVLRKWWILDATVIGSDKPGCRVGTSNLKISASFLTDSYCEQREWFALRALVQVKYNFCKDIFPWSLPLRKFPWSLSLRKYQIYLKHLVRCPKKIRCVDWLRPWLKGHKSVSASHSKGAFFIETGWHLQHTGLKFITVFQIYWGVGEVRILTQSMAM